MSKIAAKKTAGVLGDDLALNAQQVAGVQAERELPVVWAVALGSLKNKCILVPAALAISAFIPWAVTPLLMIGGAYLCYEGCEKIAHHRHQPNEAHQSDCKPDLISSNAITDVVAFEQSKIRGAIRTDFILSAEIITIALGTVAGASFSHQIAVLTVIAVAMTVGVYGLVAGIVKLDDAGAYLIQKRGNTFFTVVQKSVGKAILKIAPWLMKVLSTVGTVAMFMVGGGILTHGIPGMHSLVNNLMLSVGTAPGTGEILAMAVSTFIDILTGVAAGSVLLFSVGVISKKE